MLVTMGEWKNFTRTTASAAQRLYIEQCDLAYNHVMTGVVGYAQAIKEAVNNVVSNGVTVTMVAVCCTGKGTGVDVFPEV